MPVRAAALATSILAILVALVLVAPRREPGLSLRDFEAYYAAGATWRYHGDPYGREVWRVEKTIPGVVATRDELLPFVGPPYGLPLWSELSRLDWRPATVAWYAVLGLSFASILLGALRLAGGRIDSLDCAGALALGAGFAPLTGGVALGQVAIVAIAAIVLAPLALALRRSTLPVAACALVAALQPNLALALAALATVRRTWAGFIAAAAIALLGSAIALGDRTGLSAYLDVLRAHAAAERFIAIQVTMGAVARALGVSARGSGAFALAVATSVALALVIQLARGGYRPAARLALACAALPLALPFAHEHDLSIVLLPSILTLRRARGTAWSIAAFATVLVAVDWIGLAQHPMSTTSSALAAGGAALAIVTLAREQIALRHLAPALLSLAVVAAGALAATHPLATWPNALGADFTVPRQLAAAEVWHLEQLRSGITTLDAVWGTLRLLSLAGCFLLWIVASRELREEPAR